MVKGSSIYRCWNGPMCTHGSFICECIGAEISNWACRPRSDAYAWLQVMRTHRLQQWLSRFCCDLSVLFALSGHFRSKLRLNEMNCRNGFHHPPPMAGNKRPEGDLDGREPPERDGDLHERSNKKVRKGEE
ncbi:hypothetical protein PIB30_035992 [Stylosanthes scabra]|uniref:Uncharacterized protein n=1 Tax=Stylosanthes scabra TaxID=79078 RepID=A0ABU6UG11_9FABA|nr:hypothetical protein [Stylosanthes scabra]